MASLRRDIASGLIVVIPLAVILLALQYLIRVIAGLPLVSAIEPPLARVPAVLVVFVAMAIATGYAMRSAVGVLIADLIGDAINHVPVLRVVYNASHIALETALNGEEGRIDAVKIRSWDGLWVTTFDTGHRTDDGRVLCFFPTSPNITTGYVIEVEESDLRRSDESVERALMRVLSAGYGDGGGERTPLPGARFVEHIGEAER